MSEIKALGQLRGLRDEAASKMVDNPNWVCRRAEEIADEIEAEIAERFMELPVDADGVPIHAGDMLLDYKTARNVVAVSPVCVVMGGYEDGASVRLSYARNHRHVKPRTLEDALADFSAKVLNSGHQWGLDAQEAISGCAAEIREMMGGTE